MKTILLSCCCLLLAFPLLGQELNVKVRMNTQKLQQADPKVFETLKSEIEEFMNTQKWTDDEFKQEERIDVTLAITIQEEVSPTAFKADFGVQATRPVFGAGYETPLLNYIDRLVTFTYEQYQPIQFSETRYNDNLSAVLAFYAYMVLGLDYDSFSPYGGEPHFQMAQQIMNSVPESAASVNPGWRAIDGDPSRYFFVENLLSPRVREFRQGWYEYHRQGLDVAATDVSTTRAIIIGALEQFLEVDQAYPNSMIIQVFSDTKSNEIMEIFRVADPQQKNTVINIMTELDASNASEYRSLK